MSALKLVKANELTSISSGGLQTVSEFFDHDRGIFVFARGFGGPKAGQEAANRAVSRVRDFLVTEAGDREATLPYVLRKYYTLTSNILFNSFLFANQELGHMNSNKSVHLRGGCSMVAGYLDGHILSIASVGGLGLNLMRGVEIAPLAVPRTYSRLKNPFSREAEPAWDVPLMALGITSDVEPEIQEYEIKSGDEIIVSPKEFLRLSVV